MRSSYALGCLLVLHANSAVAQGGQTCTTAEPVGPGVHVAWPHLGSGYQAPACAGWWPANHASWFAYTPTITGMVSIRSCANGAIQSLQDTRLSVFVGQCGALQTVGCETGCWSGLFYETAASYVDLFVTAGITYYIQWDDSPGIGAIEWGIYECVGTGNGTTYIDQNGNGAHDGGEPTRYMLVHAEPEDETFYSGGDYSHCSDVGVHTLTVVDPPPHHIQNTTSRTYTITAPDDVVNGLDFGFIPIPGIHDGEAVITHSTAWIGQNTLINCMVRNIGTEQIDPVATLTLDPHQTWVSAGNPQPTSISGQQIVWDLPPMLPGTQLTFSGSVHTDNATPPGTAVVSYLTVAIAGNDVDVSNDQYVEVSPAFVSCDPNDKEVSAATITPVQVAQQEPLGYSIHFQNTGTAPAVNIVIVDSLDSDWDLSTFEMVGSTHPCTVSMNDGVLRWAFPNIMLPDSGADLEASQGTLYYRMAPKNSLVLGDQLRNRADIYFDFNEAVLTQTAVTTVAIDNAIAESGAGSGMAITPSPTSGMVSVVWSSADLGKATFTVVDALGRTVHSAALNAANATSQRVDLSFLSDGTYLARLTGSNREAWTRFVMQR